MKTIALRFAEYFAPECGTIEAHKQVIDRLGYVWYGKMGNPISKRIFDELLSMEDTVILLIHSGKSDRYWAHVSEIKNEVPELNGIPHYYRDMVGKFKTWFKISSFEIAPRDVMSKCRVVASGAILGEVSKHSMSPYFIIQYEENIRS